MSKFSEDIFFEILSWLPVSSLLRFRLVCKSWFILITQNSSFAKVQLLHANSTQIDNPTALFTSDYHGTLNSLKYVDIASSSSSSSLENVYESLVKHPATLYSFNLVASCNGLICLTTYEPIICLWNPSTEEIKELPIITFKHPTQRYRLLAFGFGCNRTLDDYKAIRIIQFVSTLDVWDDNEENLYINVYTLATNSWKRIRDMRCKFRLSEAPSGLHINGGLHWIGSVSPSESNNGIISFDIKDEEFREVPKPQCLGGMDNPRLQVLGGCLCIFNFDSEYCLDVWMMKDYGVKESWTKLFTTTQFRFMNHYRSMDHHRLKPLWLFKHGKILMGMEIYAKFFPLYDPNCDTFEYLGTPFNVGWFDTVTYIESLVSLESGYYAHVNIYNKLKRRRNIQRRRGEILTQ